MMVILMIMIIYTDDNVNDHNNINNINDMIIMKMTMTITKNNNNNNNDSWTTDIALKRHYDSAGYFLGSNTMHQYAWIWFPNGFKVVQIDLCFMAIRILTWFIFSGYICDMSEHLSNEHMLSPMNNMIHILVPEACSAEISITFPF